MRYAMDATEASTWAVLADRIVKFDDRQIVSDPGENYQVRWGGEYGTAYPCGCVNYETVLSDGSIGWGSWMDECSECFYDYCS